MKCGCQLSSQKNQIVGLPSHLKSRLLSGLKKGDLEFLMSVAKHRQLRAGSVIVQQEDPAEHLFLLTSGQGRHFVMTDKGRKILLLWLTAGQIFGGASMMEAPSQYLASMELVTDGCVWMWDRPTLREFTAHCPRLLDNCFSIAVTAHVAWFVASQISLMSDDARGRVAHLLVSLACAIGRNTPSGIELAITNEDLSAGANVTPFTVSRILSDWQREGIVRKGRGKVLLRNPFLLAPGTEMTDVQANASAS